MIIHLAETHDERRPRQKQHKMSPTRYLESLGFWGPRTLAAHGVWLDAADIADPREARGRRVAQSREQHEAGQRHGQVPAMRTASVHVGLGTDGAASNNDLDMFEAMRQAAFLHKLRRGDPRALPAKDALAMATIDGARALGMADRVGSLEAGKRADLIVVSMAGARQTPMYDPLSHLVYVARGDDVRTTIVNGKVLMRDRKLLTLNEADVISEANEFAAAGPRGGEEVNILLDADDDPAAHRRNSPPKSSATIPPAKRSTWSASSRAASCSWRIWSAP